VTTRANSNVTAAGAEACQDPEHRSEETPSSPARGHELALALLPPHGLSALWFAESAGLHGPGPC